MFCRNIESLAINKDAPGLNSGQLSSFWLLKGANQLKFIGECQFYMVPHVSAEKKSTNGLICLKMDGVVLRMNSGLEGLQK